jgi:hypothetical protein
MGAAIDHCVDFAVFAAGNDNRRLAEERRLVVARVWQLVRQRQELPSRAEEQLAELRLIDALVGEDAVGNPCIAFFRPGNGVLVHGFLRRV